MAIFVSKVKQNRARVPLHKLIIKLIFNEESKGRPKKIPRIRIRVGRNIFEPGQASHFEGESLVL